MSGYHFFIFFFPLDEGIYLDLADLCFVYLPKRLLQSPALTHVQYILFTDFIVGFNPNEIGICKMIWINGVCLRHPADATLNDS